MNLDKFRPLMERRYEWGRLATFVPNKREPVYNWLYYKEGFSRELALKLIEMFGLKNGTVLDPFCGTGTTLLACKESGIDAIGYDVLPIAVFASQVKTSNYDSDEIAQIKEHAKILKERFVMPDKKIAPAAMKRTFSKYALEDALFFKKKISVIENKKIRDFFLLALANAAMKSSWAVKDGGSIKMFKRKTAPLRIMLGRTIKKMIKDVERFQCQPCNITIELRDARIIELDSCIDAVITSPPYLNQIDYTRAYEIENFFVDSSAKPSLRSYIGQDSYIKDFSELPYLARAYFSDMKIVLEKMYNACKPGAKAAIVLGNAYSQQCGIIECDIIIAHIAEQAGFEVKKIFVLNERYALKNRTEKKGTLRESAVVLEKV